MKKGIQAAVGINIITSTLKYGIAILIIPLSIGLLSSLLNNLLTDAVMELIENCLNSVDYMIGSKYTNILLSVITIILAIKIAKRVQRLIVGDKEEK